MTMKLKAWPNKQGLSFREWDFVKYGDEWCAVRKPNYSEATHVGRGPNIAAAMANAVRVA